MSNASAITSELRASDADRDAAVDALRGHHSAGRLDTEELDKRVHVALAARTVSELDVPLADLPSPASGHATRRHAARWSRPALLFAGATTVAVSGITDVHFVWLLWPLVWIARPWGRRRATRPNTTVMIS